MVKKEMVKKAKSTKKVAKNKIAKDKLEQQEIKSNSYEYYQAKASNLIHNAWMDENLSEQKLERIAALLKEDDIKNPLEKFYKPELVMDGYAPNVKTTTFTSTTYDDIVSFPKYPVNKPGYHIVGKTNEIDLNEQVIKTFEKDGYAGKINSNSLEDAMKTLADVAKKFEDEASENDDLDKYYIF